MGLALRQAECHGRSSVHVNHTNLGSSVRLGTYQCTVAFFNAPVPWRCTFTLLLSSETNFDPDAQDLLALKFSEHPVQHAGLCPVTNPYLDGVPVAEALGQASPLAVVRCDAQHRVEHFQASHAGAAI